MREYYYEGMLLSDKLWGSVYSISPVFSTLALFGVAYAAIAMWKPGWLVGHRIRVLVGASVIVLAEACFNILQHYHLLSVPSYEDLGPADKARLQVIEGTVDKRLHVTSAGIIIYVRGTFWYFLPYYWDDRAIHMLDKMRPGDFLYMAIATQNTDLRGQISAIPIYLCSSNIGREECEGTAQFSVAEKEI